MHTGHTLYHYVGSRHGIEGRSATMTQESTDTKKNSTSTFCDMYIKYF